MGKKILKDDAVEMLHSNISANLENSAVATGLEKFSLHSNPKERQCQRILRLTHNCTHLPYYESNAQNSSSQAWTICKLWTSRCSRWFYKKQRNQISNCQHPLYYQKKQESSRKTSISALLTMPKPLCGSQQTVENSETDGDTRQCDLPLEKSVRRSGSNS